MDKNLIDRINELTRISRERDLTEEETCERKTLRAAYIEAFRNSTIATLDQTYIQRPDGTKEKLRKRDK